MKLRNKKTGEIKEYGTVGATTFGKGGVLEAFAVYESLAELNEEWEDYEEKGWYITENGEVRENRSIGIVEEESEYREIGNYFETKEEAEKAVEKLKAWKRLKDAGFRFGGWETDSDGDLRSVLCNRKDRVQFNNAETLAMAKDLDLLFGGEE